MSHAPDSAFAWRVAGAACVLAMFGWGFGFYGPPVYLHVVTTANGWPVGLVSAAVSAHFLFGSLVVTQLPKLHARLGIATTTRFGATALVLGVLGWALARTPFELFPAALVSGAGWAAMSAATLNAVIAPWFRRRRAAALAVAYNGASAGGVVFSPLWLLAIAHMGFAGAALALGLVLLGVVFIMSVVFFTPRPVRLDDSTPDARVEEPARSSRGLWRERSFQTLCLAMTLSLFAQIGIMAHLVSLLVPLFGTSGAGYATSATAAMAMVGRLVFGWMMSETSDARRFAAASTGIQIAGSLALLAAGGDKPAFALAGVLLFGWGLGNSISLPPTIAQAELAPADAARAIPVMVATSQAAFTFAPALYGFLRDVETPFGSGAAAIFVLSAVLQLAAVVVILAPRLGVRRP